MKNTYKCPKCGFNRILYISQVADKETRAGSGGFTPMRIAVIPQNAMMGLAVKEGYGELEAGVCRQCGYVELYVKDPSSIPVDGNYVRELVGQ